MRPMTDAVKVVLRNEHGYSSYWRARVQRPSGTWVNLGDFEGRDFLEDATVTESIDSPVATLNLKLKQEVDGLSLAPLVTTSLANAESTLLNGDRPVRVEVACMPLGTAPTVEADWLPLFSGRIDVVDASQGHVAVFARDRAGQLQDRWLEAPLGIGSTAGVAVETVMANVIAAAGLTASWPLVTSGTPLWTLGPDKLEPGALLETLQRLADQIGWLVRLRWNATAGDWRLTFHAPNRTATTADWTFTEAMMRGGIRSLPIDVRDVRNVVEVVYPDRGDLDAKGKPKRKKATATVVSPYERRWMQVIEDASSNVDSTSEATRMAQAIVDDLSQSSLGASFEVDVHPCLELNDLVELEADGYHFTTAQTVAARQIVHRLSSTKANVTVVEARGKPTCSPRRWIAMDARAFYTSDQPLESSPFSGPSAPTSLAVAASPAGAVLTWKAADNGPKAATYEVHRSTSAAFTPTTSTLLGIADTTRFDVTGLTSGTTYYFKVVPRDSLENVGDTSAEVTTAAGYVEPRAMQPYVTTASMIPNPDFEAQNDEAAPPDTWTFEGVWGTDAIMDSTTSFTGLKSVKFPGSGAPNVDLVSRAFTVRAGRAYELSACVKQNAYSTSAAMLQVEWLGRDFLPVDVSTLSVGIADGNLSRYYEYASTFTAPSYGGGGVAAYARLRLRRTSTTSDDVWIDSVDLWRT